MKYNRGEIATVLTLVGVGILVVGIAAGKQIVEIGTQMLSQAATTTKTLTFNATEDAYVNESETSRNYGGSSELIVNGDDEDRYAYVKFSVIGIKGKVKTAKARLYVTDNATGNGPAIYKTSNSWTESKLTWSNKPAKSGDKLADSASLPKSTWAEFSVTATVTADGVYSFVLIPTSSDGVDFSSSEGSNKPQLVVTFESSPTPTRTPTKAPTKTPTKSPTKTPTKTPTKSPTPNLTKTPTPKLTKTPTPKLTRTPTPNLSGTPSPVAPSETPIACTLDENPCNPTSCSFDPDICNQLTPTTIEPTTPICPALVCPDSTVCPLGVKFEDDVNGCPICGCKPTPPPSLQCQGQPDGTICFVPENIPTCQPGASCPIIDRLPGICENQQCIIPTPTTTPLPPTPTPIASCICQSDNSCDSTCVFVKVVSSNISYASPLQCSPSFATASAEMKTSFCQRQMRGSGDADGIGDVNLVDFDYYRRTVLLDSTIPPFVNADFNGDGEVGTQDALIVLIKLGIVPAQVP